VETVELVALIDEYNKVREARLEMGRQLDKLERQENQMEVRIITAMKEQHLTAAGANTCLVRLHSKDVPHVKDWNLLYEHIKSTESWELLQRRVTPTAIADRWNMDVEIPGVERFPIESLSISQTK